MKRSRQTWYAHDSDDQDTGEGEAIDATGTIRPPWLM